MSKRKKRGGKKIKKRGGKKIKKRGGKHIKKQRISKNGSILKKRSNRNELCIKKAKRNKEEKNNRTIFGDILDRLCEVKIN